MNSYIFAAVVLYTAWAIYSGYKYVNGRYQWLEQPEIAHRICKYVAILGMGLYCWCGHDCEMGCCSSIENGRSQIAEQKGAIKWRTLKL